MLEDEGERNTSVVPLYPVRAPEPATPAESLRLIRAFITLSDPAQRLRIIEWVEHLSARETPEPQ